MPNDLQQEIRGMLDEFGDAVAAQLATLSLQPHASPIFRPFSLAVLRDAEKVIVGFSPATGMSSLNWFDQPTERYAPAAMVDLVQNRLGREIAAVVVLAQPDSTGRSGEVLQAAVKHAREVESAHALGKLGDLTGVAHLEPYLRQFLVDHPDYERNVFVMMRFAETPQMKQIHSAIRGTLATRGMRVVRADDRDYTGELWSNIEVYLTGCKYGIAVFEDIDSRDYNPNVSLELGYLMGRRKRTLLLKEKRLPRLPSDVVHRLYKEFDIFDIEASIEREVGRWVDVDLGLRP